MKKVFLLLCIIAVCNSMTGQTAKIPSWAKETKEQKEKYLFHYYIYF